MVWDVLRVIAALAGIAVIGGAPFVLAGTRMPWHQWCRMLGTPLVAVAVIGAYYSQLGTPPTSAWRLIAITAGMVLAAVGLVPLARQTRRGLTDSPPPRRDVDGAGASPDDPALSG